MTLSEIYKPLDIYLKEYNRFFRSLIRTNVSLLDLILRYITKKKGKQIRPAMVILSAELCGGVNKRTYIGASMIEFLHTATLIHDDVVDESDKRRGLATINFSWNNKIAVLVGDYLLSKGLLSAIDNDEFDFLKATSNAVKRMSEGELLQIQKSKEFNINEDIYFKIISDKTASLISTCTKIGAISATSDVLLQDKLKTYGEMLGMAFQIKDDIFDILGKSNTIGKPIGNDIKEKKITLPLIFSLKNSEPNKSKEILKTLKKNNLIKKDIFKIINFIKNAGGVEYAQNIAKNYVEKAISELDIFPNTEAKQSLIKFANFVIEREK
jgi:octaprenyl-diphosphate synthase